MSVAPSRLELKRLEGAATIEAWDAYCRRHPAAMPYHLPAWSRAVASALGHESHSLYAEDARGITGVLPLFLRRSRLFGTNLVSVPAANVCGPLADDEATACLLIDGAIELARSLNVDFLELRDGLPESPPADRLRLDRDRYVTVVIDLAGGEAEVWKRCKKRIRQRVRRGQEAGLSFELGKDLTAFYPVYAATMKRLGSPPFAPRFFGELLDQFGDMAAVGLARLGSVTAAVDFLVTFHGVQYSLFAGSLAEMWTLYPNQFLLWAELQQASAGGLRTFDLGRSLVGSGPLDFKLSWGGRVVPLTYGYHLERARRMPDRTPDTFLYRALGRIWSRLPSRVSTSLGPGIVKHLF